MDVARTAVSIMGLEDKETTDSSPDANMRKAIRILAKTPTALAAFNGRVSAWDEGNMYRIDPSLGKVEDILEGVGCIGPNAVTVTDYGMIFCDKNNIYLHDGQTAKAIGDPILNNTSRDNVVLSTPSEEQLSLIHI